MSLHPQDHIFTIIFVLYSWVTSSQSYSYCILESHLHNHIRITFLSHVFKKCSNRWVIVQNCYFDLYFVQIKFLHFYFPTITKLVYMKVFHNWDMLLTVITLWCLFNLFIQVLSGRTTLYNSKNITNHIYYCKIIP